ncbi:MAG: hypothetical protein D6734_03905 [Candidatus Schekmanbacteria bacterium]|nr:MAG: hypothetical protein D6734_03905 [Candidatus Schekmanbacteria bacterium]
MDKLKFSILDLFGFVFPGLLTLLAIFVMFDKSIVEISDLGLYFISINLSTGLLIAIAAFIIGFAIDQPGTWLYNAYNMLLKKIKNKTIPREIATNSKLNMKEFRALAREYCPQNFYWLQLWKTFKTMGHNFAVAGLIMAFSAFKKNIQTAADGLSNWLILAIAMIIFALLFLHRARVFDTWHYEELVIAVKTLKLEEKVMAD